VLNFAFGNVRSRNFFFIKTTTTTQFQDVRRSETAVHRGPRDAPTHPTREGGEGGRGEEAGGGGGVRGGAGSG
jgi:hypothetical protein